MKTHLALAVAGAITLTACGSKTDVSEKNFGAAIKQPLEKNGGLCLGLGAVEWPVDVSEDNWKAGKENPTSIVGKMEALAVVDLVSGTDSEIDEVIWDINKEIDEIIGTINVNRTTGRKLVGKRYALTDAGKKFYRKQGGDICYGNFALDKIVKWTEPSKWTGGDYQKTCVTYQYKIDDLAGWAKKPEIQTAFPDVGKIIERAEKRKYARVVIQLTSRGWEAIGPNEWGYCQ
ncbi:hypothetical protein D8B24_13310 [Verminephrobacter aporrectodeae subsp. tuberculatae]|uniref:hypothetical protein n=1 Tax=Verminephrobacter aporrectodeae TaxID=1110389 RepID=UPI002243D52F|nr:hypothetical protein [Verminephrobacter aporrectodeae]MCW8208003.1 hypothetical protein [Verminephrobacter aporrectodeae subsp. tuberculatae]